MRVPPQRSRCVQFEAVHESLARSNRTLRYARHAVTPWGASLLYTVPVNGCGFGWEPVYDGDLHDVVHLSAQRWSGVLIVDDGHKLFAAIREDGFVCYGPRLIYERSLRNGRGREHEQEDEG
ncbi:ascorbate oxidase [Gracilaria domingensis]|nr:ascorbate oxidase [Gracilaria domingensis]